VAAAEKSGSFELYDSSDAYLLAGHFDQERTLAFLQEVLDRSKREGFTLTRFIARMDWTLEDRRGVDDLVEYEVRLNEVLRPYKDPVICTYDLSKFDGSAVVDVMRTHPMIIIGGILQENPFFVSPDEFLRELRQRHAPRDA
jgi:MEDS: MEthanogen/methylotroph, DcmR Sensory domain